MALFHKLPELAQNFIITISVLLIVAGMYWVTNSIWADRPGISLAFALDHAIPFLPWTAPGYALYYAIIILPAFTIRQRQLLLRTLIGFVLMSLVALVFFALFPVRMARPGIPTQEYFFYWAAALTYILDQPVNCFPSLHAADAVFVAACTWVLSRRVGIAAAVAAGIVVLSTITLKQHYVADTAAGVLLGFATYYGLCHRKFHNMRGQMPSENLTYPPRTAFWVLRLYALMVLFFWLLFQSGLRFEPVLPNN
ncbi:MAG: phosphatase PAP2 family protein [Turneriella sp.]|nr:phosphatase PAP2 family protein [Leptospiraceae bacterium]MCX7632306.1 phosphatase PAP2 family protein [Turneriella sp.]